MQLRIKREAKKRNTLHIIIMVLIVLQIVSLSLIGIQFVKFNQDLEKSKDNLNISFSKSLEDYKIQNQQKIDELVHGLAAQEIKQEDFAQSISKIKASQSDFSGIIAEVVKGVVAVVTDTSLGTGFFVDSDGYIITNQHVIADAKKISILTYDKKTFNASVILSDEVRDLALLKINKNYNELELTDSDNLQLGEKVIAIGNPLGLSFSVTEGIVSGLNRRGPNNLKEYIQTDVSLNPGNSGGPLIDRTGKVVGINNFKIGGAENLGFAVESNSIGSTINKLANSTIIK